MSECTCPADKMPFGRCCKAPTSADVIAGLEMALAQAAAMKVITIRYAVRKLTPNDQCNGPRQA